MEVACDIEMIKDPESRRSNVTYVARHIEDALTTQREYRDGCTIKCRHCLAKSCCLWFGKRYGNYLICLYLITKSLYILNVVGQFFMMNRFLGTNYTFYGLDLLRDITEGYLWQESGNFPRITLCDFEIRKLANKHRHTVQCVLPINMFNEKIFIFLWFWFILVAAINTSSFLYWSYKSSLRANRVHFVRKFLKLREALEPGDKKRSFAFVDNYLRQDGTFILRLVAQNAGELVASEIAERLWQMYRQRCQTPLSISSPTPGQFTGFRGPGPVSEKPAASRGLQLAGPAYRQHPQSHHHQHHHHLQSHQRQQHQPQQRKSSNSLAESSSASASLQTGHTRHTNRADEQAATMVGHPVPPPPPPPPLPPPPSLPLSSQPSMPPLPPFSSAHQQHYQHAHAHQQVQQLPYPLQSQAHSSLPYNSVPPPLPPPLPPPFHSSGPSHLPPPPPPPLPPPQPPPPPPPPLPLPPTLGGNLTSPAVGLESADGGGVCGGISLCGSTGGSSSSPPPSGVSSGQIFPSPGPTDSLLAARSSRLPAASAGLVTESGGPVEDAVRRQPPDTSAPTEGNVKTTGLSSGHRAFAGKMFPSTSIGLVGLGSTTLPTKLVPPATRQPREGNLPEEDPGDFV